MGIVTGGRSYQTIQVRRESDICFVRLDRPKDNNTICQRLIEELGGALEECERSATIVVLEGSPEVFCLGADFNEVHQSRSRDSQAAQDPEALYELWLKLATGPFVSIAHVRGRVNAGGVGFVAACDLTLGERKAVFSLSELMFGLMPACVLPFLVRRVGPARANYMTLTARAIPASQALEWGLIDACEDDSESLLRKHLLPLRRLSKQAIVRYKAYMGGLYRLAGYKEAAVRANREVFADPVNVENISRYVLTGQFPWEALR